MNTGSELASGARLQAARTRNRRPARDAILLNGERFGLVALLVLSIAAYTLWGRTSAIFPSSANFSIIVGNQAVLALVAIAAIMPLICGGFDLSVGSVLGVSAILCAKLFADTSLPMIVCIVAPGCVGALIGAVNGLLITRLNINPLITTLGMATVLGGIGTWITDGQPIIAGVPASLTSFGAEDTAGVPNAFYVLAAGAVVVWFLLEQTPFGRQMRAVGANPTAAHLVGLPVQRVVIGSYLLSGALAGLAGALQLARSGSGDPQIGFNLTLPALAAAFLGATAIKPGHFNVFGTLVAIFFLAVNVSGLILAGAQTYVQDLFNGSALVVGVATSTLIARQRQRPARGRPHSDPAR